MERGLADDAEAVYPQCPSGCACLAPVGGAERVHHETDCGRATYELIACPACHKRFTYEHLWGTLAPADPEHVKLLLQATVDEEAGDEPSVLIALNKTLVLPAWEKIKAGGCICPQCGNPGFGFFVARLDIRLRSVDFACAKCDAANKSSGADSSAGAQEG